MKLIRYSALLLGLILITLLIFVWTKEGQYDEREQYTINLPKEFVYDYIQNIQNWQDFFKDQNGNTYVLQSKDSVWNPVESTSNSTLKNLTNNKSVPATFLSFNWDWFNHQAQGNFEFEQQDNQTTLTFSWGGELSFIEKAKSIIGISIIDEQKSLMKKNMVRLREKLLFEYLTFSIELPQMITQNNQYYLEKKLNVTKEEFLKNIFWYATGLSDFIVSNQIELVNPIGMEFSLSQPEGSVILSSWLKDEIYTTPESEITSGIIPQIDYLKVRFKGNYHHWTSALQKGREHLKNNPEGIIDPEQRLRMEFVVSIQDERQPSKWVTDLYIPIKKKTDVTPATD